jgi:protoporphyrinogen oxidase
MLDVLVVGAGAAGLGAARKIADAAAAAAADKPLLSVAVVEARRRIGGRTHTATAQVGVGISDEDDRSAVSPHDSKNEGHVVELGAEFLHSDRSSCSTWALLDRYGLTANEGGNLRTCYVERGGCVGRLEEPLAGALDTAVWGIGDAAARWALAHADTDPDTVDGAGERLLPVAGDTFTDEDIELLHNAAAQIIGADLDDASIAGLLQEGEEEKEGAEEEEGEGEEEGWVDIDGEGPPKTQFRVDSGYSELWRRLAADLDVRLGVAVTRIEHRPGGSVRVTTVDAAAAEQGSTTEESEIVLEAQRVIVTVPLAVLQRRAIEFVPALSERKLRAIDGLGAGQCAKVHIYIAYILYTHTHPPCKIHTVWRISQGVCQGGPHFQGLMPSFLAG